MRFKTIRAKDLSYKDILSSINFDLHQGEIVALMGENGSGKSTLTKLLTGLLEPDSGDVELYQGDTLCNWKEYPRWREIALVGQHPRRQTVGASVTEELGFGLLNLGYDVHEVRAKTKELARLVGLEGKENQSPSTLSGGERQRLVTAAILAMNPAFLVLDEALTMLDQKAQRQILALLLKDKTTIGQLWVTHDPEVAVLADRLLLIKGGKLVDAGQPTALEDTNLRREYGIRSPERFITSIGKRIKTDVSTLPVLEWNIASYGTRLELDKVIRAGEFIGIMGPSGAGKTTILESVIGLNRPTEGKFSSFGVMISKANMAVVRQRSRLVLQEPGEYFIGHTVYDEVFYGRKRRETFSNREENLNYLKQHGIQPTLAFRPPERLSGGERQKVALAAALQTRPEILLLDEPMLGLDGHGRERLGRYLNDLYGKLTVLYVTHDLGEVLEYANRLWLVENGRVTLDCPTEIWSEHLYRWQEAGVRIPRNARSQKLD